MARFMLHSSARRVRERPGGVRSVGGPGRYILTIRQNLTGRIMEKTTANNTVSACVQIAGVTAQPAND